MGNNRMASKKENRFSPDYLVPPGSTLKDVLDEQGMTQSDLSCRTGISEKTVSQIINGVAPITVDTADRLELVLGIPANFWNRRELAYREALTRKEETEKLEADIAWLKEIPIAELVERGVLEKTNDKPLLVRRALQFFGVSSVDVWRGLLHNRAVAFRGSETHLKKPGFVAAWRRLGVLQASKIETQPFDAQEFKAALKVIRNSITLPNWRQTIQDECAKAGVAVVFTREIKGGAISGLARWLTPDKALIQLSLKYKTDDHLWFTFFHEAGHILLHGKKNVFLDVKYSEDSEEEKQANEFSRNILIPSRDAHRLPLLKTKSVVKAYANEVGVTPGIVVGRLQHENLIYKSYMNDLKKKIAWT